MSFFFIPKKKIIVDCFTSEINAYKLFPIEKANKFIPNWMKTAPSTFEDNGISYPTIKRCNGLIDYYKHGLIIPMWSDLSVIVNNGAYNWQYSDGCSSASIHNPQQWNSYLDPAEFSNLKLTSPWIMKTKEAFNWYAIKPSWNCSLKEDYHVVPGALNFKYQHTTNINLMLDIRKNHKFIIEAGQPMIHFVPLSERPIELRHHLVSPQELSQLAPSAVKFIGSYLETVKQLKNKEKKCPFSWIDRA